MTDKDHDKSTSRPHDPQSLKQRLSPLAYAVTQEAATEPPYSGQYDKHFAEGVYHCTCCGETLFTSEHKFDSGCGWPAFDAPQNQETIIEKRDLSHGMVRTEVCCAKCNAHLGHVFPDGPTETGLRYCINSVSLDFDAE